MDVEGSNPGLGINKSGGKSDNAEIVLEPIPLRGQKLLKSSFKITANLGDK
jgi:hypothetical protein